MKEIRGPQGLAQQMEIEGLPKNKMTVAYWLITAPAYHPAWSQYILSGLKLDEDPEYPAPYLKFPGATHEVNLVAVDPRNVYTPDLLIANIKAGRSVGWLQPVNISHQFTATDEEISELIELLAQGVVDGLLNPETGDAPERIREQWLQSCVRTLAHMRGEEHAP